MSKETVKEFYEALKSDKAMVEELQKQAEAIGEKTPENVAALLIEFAAAKGYDFTAEELKAFETEAQELNKDELDKVNAASGNWAVCVFIGTGTGAYAETGLTACYGIGVGLGVGGLRKSKK